MNKQFLSASILAADFTLLGKEVNHVLQAGVDYIHFDVMDHHFVPNLSFGAVVCESLRKSGITAPIDVHLMVEHPQQYVESFARAGANLIIFHPETVKDPEGMIQLIKHYRMQAGLAFNPEKPLTIQKNMLQEIDMLLIMSVNPGFAGQSFLTETLQKVQEARQMIDQAQTHTLLGIDGGIKIENIATAKQAGANFFVVGSGLFHADDYTSRVKALRDAINQ